MVRLPPIALTMGEPAGIGGEIALKAWSRSQTAGSDARGLPPFFVIDDPVRLAGCAKSLDEPYPLVTIDSPADALDRFQDGLPVLPVDRPVDARPGSPLAANAEAVIASIERAVEFCMDGDAAALVTNPIHKATLYETGFEHPGHTEFLAHLAGPDATSLMMLAIPGLRVVPVTVHVPLAQVPEALSKDAIVEAGRITANALRTDFGVDAPRIAVAALNPHAGEAGSLGREETEIIAPAIAALCDEGIAASGPAPADTLFHEAARRRFDAVICMYHDQALIPLKTIDFDHGVNITLGLPFVRTSPDHGTAFDIAGTGKANPASLIAALSTAADIARHRQRAAGPANLARNGRR